MDRAHTVGTSDPWHDVLAAVAAFISGVRYGVKIRLPHALVMVVMFRRDLSTRGKLRAVMKAVMEHATSLASFAVIYKCTLALLRVLQRRYDGALRNDLREFMSTKSLGRLLMNMMGEFDTPTIMWYRFRGHGRKDSNMNIFSCVLRRSSASSRGIT